MKKGTSGVFCGKFWMGIYSDMIYSLNISFGGSLENILYIKKIKHCHVVYLAGTSIENYVIKAHFYR